MININQSIKELFGVFPREVGKNKRFIINKEQFNNYVSTINGRTDCYSSIYQIRKEEYVYRLDNGKDRRRRVYKSVIINKLYYDLDKFSTCWDTIKDKFHPRLVEEDIKHTIILSGGGFHPYIMTKPFTLESLSGKVEKTEQRLKLTLKNAQHGVISIINEGLNNGDKITIGKPKKCDIDYHVIGDIGRIARIPNTWHPTRKRYAIPILEEDFKLSFEELLLKAKKQRKGIQFWGNKLIDLKDYDREITVPIGYELNDTTNSVSSPSSLLSLLPQFLQNLLTSREDGHRARYLIQVGMKTRGFPKSIAIDVCKQYWSKKKYLHAIYGHGYNSFDYIWSRNDLFFPNWKTLKEEGWKIPNEDLDFKFMNNK